MVQILKVSWNLVVNGSDYRNPVTDPHVLEGIQKVIESHEWYKAEVGKIMPNAPQFGMVGGQHECEIQWCDGEGWPINSVSISRDKWFNFGAYIKRITYGGQRLLDKPAAYRRLHKAMMDRIEFDEKADWNPVVGWVDAVGPRACQITLDNNTLEGDPDPGVRKEVVIEFFGKDQEPDVKNLVYNEGASWPEMSWEKFLRGQKAMTNYHDSYIRKNVKDGESESEDEDEDKADDDEADNDEPNHEESSGGDGGGGGGDTGGGD